jgi:DNA replication and repair protein RecF
MHNWNLSESFTFAQVILNELSLTNFRSYGQAHLTFEDRVVCFVGKNGSGKTNLLDGIYYLAYCKSYFNPADHQVIRHDEPFLALHGKFDLDGEAVLVSCGLKRGQRKVFKKNDKEYGRLADHIGVISVVMISPTDQFLITEGSEDRRRFVDSVISLNDKNYLEALMTYNRLMVQRNALLKQMGENRHFDPTVLEILDMQLDLPGNYIFQSRQAFLADFEKVFERLYQEISNTDEKPEIRYESSLMGTSMEQLLLQNQSKDFNAWTTTMGVHKDDFEFVLNGFPLKKYASQGQQKTYLLALKLAQFYWLKETKDVPPILLLDDIFEKLDQSRVEHLFKLVSSKDFGQVFISDTDETRIKQAFAKVNINPQFFHIPTDTEV